MLTRRAMLIAAFGVVPVLSIPVCATAAERLPALSNAAVGQAAGIRVIIEPDAWTRHPPDLERWVTPLRLTIDNESSRPLRLRFEELVLTDGSLVLRPVAPHVLASRLAAVDSSAAPPPAQPVSAAPRSATSSSPATSPAASRSDVMTFGLREGVVAPGDRAWGFLYYERGDAPLESLRFELRLVDSRTGEQFGTLRIPLARG